MRHFRPRTPYAPNSVFGWPTQIQPTSPPWPSSPVSTKPLPAQRYNTFAMLSPIFAVVVPPVGVVLGHLALPHIRRSRELGRSAAICGLAVGYALTVALIAALIVWSTSGPAGSADSTAADSSTIEAAPAPIVPSSVVTSVAPAPIAPRVKLDLSKVPIGTCAHIEKRDVGDDALDLFAAPCEHREGVYTVVGRVDRGSDCHSTYVAAPPDHSLAVCLSEY